MPNRTICAVLDEMRVALKNLNFSYMLGLIDEAQSLANKMEAAIWDQREIKDLRKEIRKLREIKTKLEEKK